MENWFKRFFLTLFILCSGFSVAEEQTGAETGASVDAPVEEAPDIVDPDANRIILNEWNIEALDTEIGVLAGLISVQDFGTNPLTGLRLAFHLSDDFFIEANRGQTTLHKTSFEKLQKGFQLLSDSQREYSFYDIGVGYNLFQGESFFQDNRAFNSAFYLLAGTGSTTFANDKLNTFSWGFGYRVVFLDWLAVHLDTRDHIFESDIFTKNEQFHSISMQVGLSFFF